MRVPEEQRTLLREALLADTATAGAALGPDRALRRLAAALAIEMPPAQWVEGVDGAHGLGLSDNF